MVGDAFNDGFVACSSSKVAGVIKELLSFKNRRKREEEMARVELSGVESEDHGLVRFSKRNRVKNGLEARNTYRKFWGE